MITGHLHQSGLSVGSGASTGSVSTRAMDDDHEHFVRLLTECQPVLRAFVVSLLPGAPGADDVIQETNTVLWRKRADFVAGTNFKAWALTIARYQTYMHLRSVRRQRWTTLDEDVMELLSDDISNEPDPKYEIRRVEALQACMEKMRPADRELLLERYWNQMRLQDFAVLKGRSESGLKVQLFRLRAALKKCVERVIHPKPFSA